MRIVSLFLCLAVVVPIQAKTWYVRPKTGEYGAENGTSYETAWDGLSSIVWGEGGVQAGDTLYVCGTFTWNTDGYIVPLLAIGASGTDGNPIVVRGDYAGDPGALVAAVVMPAASWNLEGSGAGGSYYSHGSMWGYSGNCSWEGTIGDEYLLKLVESPEEVADTDGSYYWDSTTSTGYYNPHGDAPRDVYYCWQWCLNIGSHDYLTFEGLRFYCSQSRATSMAEASYITFSNCTFRYLKALGGITNNGYQADHITVTGCHFDTFIAAITLGGRGTDNVTISGNYFDCNDAPYNHELGWTGQSGDVGCISVQPGDNWLIENNYIKRGCSYGINLYKNASESMTNLRVLRNRIDAVGDSTSTYQGRGIDLGGSGRANWGNELAGCVIAYNIVSNVSGTDGIGIRIKPGIPTDLDDRIRLVGNTVSGCAKNLYLRNLGVADASGLGVILQNNISYVPAAGGYHIYAEAMSTTLTNLLMSHNCWYPDTADGSNKFVWASVERANFAGFVSAAAAIGIAIETGSRVSDPDFRNPVGGDYSLKSGSPCIDAGVILGVSYAEALASDSTWPSSVETRYQDAHGSGWDIGAYVYEAVYSFTLTISALNGAVLKDPNNSIHNTGEVVTLTAMPDVGYSFVGWSGDLTDGSNPATLVMDGNKSVTAVFASNVHTLTIAASGGTVTKSPDKAGYDHGESVTLTASASAGYSFTGWSGAASGTNSSVTIVMDGDKSVTANFAAISYTLSIAATNGSVVANPQKAGYSYNESVSLQAVPGTGYHFTGWSGSLSGSTNPASIVMNADKSVTAGFAINTYTLTTSATNGSVVKSPQAATYTHGSTVSVQAVAAEGYEFAGWSGAVSGSANPVEIVMDSSKSVTAAFTVKTYTLTTSATNGSVVRSPESVTYAHGSTVSVQAVAAEGYHFTGWSGAVSGSSNPVSLVMDASKSVTAAFAANAYTLSISASNGTVTANPSQATYTHGQVVTLTATPSTGYSFSSWSGDASGTAASTTVTMDGNKSVTAAFTLNNYTLSISFANGTVTRDPVQATYTHGQTITLTAVPATGYSFSSWSGDLSGTVASATITMDGNKSVAAGFTINSYTLNTSGANGSITRNPDKSTYNHGEMVTLQAVPVEGYNFVNWSGDLAGSANPATLVMDSNKTVAAAFATNTYTLQTNATNGSVTRTPDQASFTFGQTVTLTAVPAAGYSFSSWSGDASGSTATVTITMNADKSVTAGFTANAYTLSVSASNGSVTVSPIRGTYAHGEVVTLTAVPSVGYSFGSWSGDASGTATSTTVTMDSNKSVTAAFALNTYTLSVTSANGTVTKDPSLATYNHGDTVALTASPAEGYRFAGWSGDLTGSSNPATLTMTSNKSVTTHFTAVSNDNEAPVLFGFSPLADAIQVPLNSLVLLRITDSGDGVDANTVTIRVNDNVVYAGNVASASGVHGVCRRVGTPAHYVYAFQPVEDFDYDSTVAVTVNAADLAGNAMAQQSYSFRTQMRTFGSNHCASWGPDGLDKGGAATVCDAGGNVWVVWHAGQAGSRDIYLSRLTSGQGQFSGPIQLTSNASDQCNPDIAIGPDGRLFVVWQDNRRGNWDIYLRTSADGVTWSSEIEATDFTNDETNPVIAVDARSPSYAYIAWQDNRAGNQDIYVASSSTHFASKTVTRVTSNVQDQIGPRIAVDGANVVYLVWTDFRNGAADVYGAASSSGSWTNVAVATGAGSQSAPDIAAEPGGYSLHFVWVNRVDNQDDVFYGTSIGLPASPLAGMNIIDDTSSADQRTPAIVAAGSGGTARVFAAWQDFRNAADGLDTDLYAAEIKAGSVTNLFVGDGWTRTNQTEPCIGVDLFGRPYVVWTDERNAKDEIYFAASTFVEPTPLDVRMVVGATGGTVGVASPTQLDDVSVVIPAGACPYDVTVSIARIWNLEPDLPADILPYEFGPSGLQFEAPVTITIPYAVADFAGAPPQPYWYDAMTGAMSQQGITNIQHVTLSSTLRALRFQTTHFTPYAVVGEVQEGVVPRGGGGGGGGCSLSPAAAGACGALEYFVPFTALALAMIGLRIKDTRRHSKPQ